VGLRNYLLGVTYREVAIISPGIIEILEPGFTGNLISPWLINGGQNLTIISHGLIKLFKRGITKRLISPCADLNLSLGATHGSGDCGECGDCDDYRCHCSVT
jgi:hypothetical protein